MSVSADTPFDASDMSPRLNWAEDGSPRSGRFGDVYFSRDDGLAETRAVFLEGCGLPDAWAGRTDFTVAELGFGTGLNIVALLDLWRRDRPEGGRLHVFTIEGYPLSAEEAARALIAWPEVALPAATLLSRWPAATPGFHRIDLPEFGAVIDLAVGEVEWALSQWSGAADAWFLDGFSPALNPGMWSEQVMTLVAARSAPGARVATFTVAGAVRRGLTQHGFTVEKKPGHGRKRERLEARLDGETAVQAPRRIAVVGAGIAGAATARALAALGHVPVVIEVERPGAGASGFPASLVTPRLDAGDRLIAGLHAQALERARALYRAVPGAVLAEGILQLPQAPRDAGRFDKIAAQDLWPEGAMTVIDAEAATARLGEPVGDGGLWMGEAMAVSGAAALSAWLDGVEQITARVQAVVPHDSGWRLTVAGGDDPGPFDVVIVTAGWGSAQIAPELGLSPVRGQADWVEGQTTAPVAWGGYAVPTRDGVLFGATHDRDRTDTAPSTDDTARNRATLAARLPELAARIAEAPTHSHAAVRATTPDRLPLAGALEAPGLFVLTGLGSRGFCLAPLLGEHVAALATGGASPLPAEFAHRLAPLRNQR